jgi:2-polyprenyl-3-methyl-5-hydroxy-6-metoxy-1,4-benzoquinol methylase
MALLSTLGFSPALQGRRVGRPWRQRVEDLCACGVDYSDKTVLDAGCNVGILAYEISKLGPSYIHAIDGSRPLLNAARLILRSVETPHRLDLVDLADDPRLRIVLEPSYDIVQLLAVYQHSAPGEGRRCSAAHACNACRAVRLDIYRRLAARLFARNHRDAFGGAVQVRAWDDVARKTRQAPRLSPRIDMRLPSAASSDAA